MHTEGLLKKQEMPEASVSCCQALVRDLRPEDRDKEDAIKARKKDEYQRAYEKGEKEGYEAGMQKAMAIAGKLSETLKAIRGSMPELLKSHAKDIIDLSFAIAGKITGREIAVNKDALVASVKEAARAASETGLVHIRVNPEDLAFLEEHRDMIENMNPGFATMFEGDASLEKGGCRLIGESVEIDATIKTRLDLIYGQLTEGISVEDGH